MSNINNWQNFNKLAVNFPSSPTSFIKFIRKYAAVFKAAKHSCMSMHVYNIDLSVPNKMPLLAVCIWKEMYASN